ncbi:MAG: RHS repeat-associated core domain-containing protein [Candidatus Buchananbacteria bacterium]|nr:RHS repeat-associated core domain-containing protein [Candidatus Buchananbacteria bacterium]
MDECTVTTPITQCSPNYRPATWRRLGFGSCVTVNQTKTVTTNKNTKQIYLGDLLLATVETENGKDSIYYVHTDHLTGSNVITDSGGKLAQALDYYPFGGVRIDEKTGVFSEQKKFTGKELDKDTGLYYYGARYYDGRVGRFTGVDPAYWDSRYLSKLLVDPQSWNSYAYARNNPLRLIDPDGWFWREVYSFTQGVGNAIVSDNALGFGRQNRNDSYFNSGQKVGDAIAMVQGSYETAAGIVTTAAGAAGGIVMSPSGAGAIVGAGVSVGGVAATGHGISVVANSMHNLQKGGSSQQTNNSSTAQKIGHGHAYDKHVLNDGQFKGMVSNKSEFSSHIKNVMDNPTEVRQLEKGRTAYYQQNTNSIVIHDPSRQDAGTAFQPNPQVHGYDSDIDYFNKGLR